MAIQRRGMDRTYRRKYIPTSPYEDTRKMWAIIGDEITYRERSSNSHVSKGMMESVIEERKRTR